MRMRRIDRSALWGLGLMIILNLRLSKLLNLCVSSGSRGGGEGRGGRVSNRRRGWRRVDGISTKLLGQLELFVRVRIGLHLDGSVLSTLWVVNEFGAVSITTKGGGWWWDL